MLSHKSSSWLNDLRCKSWYYDKQWGPGLHLKCRLIRHIKRCRHHLKSKKRTIGKYAKPLNFVLNNLVFFSIMWLSTQRCLFCKLILCCFHAKRGFGVPYRMRPGWGGRELRREKVFSPKWMIYVPLLQPCFNPF